MQMVVCPKCGVPQFFTDAEELPKSVACINSGFQETTTPAVPGCTAIYPTEFVASVVLTVPVVPKEKTFVWRVK